jgi:hypothetical protein
MRPLLLVLLLGAAACASTTNNSTAVSPTKAPDSEGAASQQGKDEATRALSEDECKSLGQSIIEVCHGQNTRSAQFEGWCSDVVHGNDTGTWVADCAKHMKYMDAVCITSNTSIRSMMDCDAAVSH